MARFMRRARKPATSINDIPLTPLIDTALTLLIIFMVTTPMLQNAIKVNLPQGQAKEAEGTQQDLVVYIVKEKDKDALQILFNGIPVTKATLINTIKAKLGSNKDGTVFVKADLLVPYGEVIQIVDQIKVVGGIKYVALATRKSA